MPLALLLLLTAAHAAPEPTPAAPTPAPAVGAPPGTAPVPSGDPLSLAPPGTPVAASPGAPPSAAGLVVRLTAPAGTLTAPVIVRLTPPGDVAADIELNDSGSPPDVVAGDGAWSGAGSVGGESVAVKVTAGGKTYDGGTVPITAGQARDLALALDGDKLTVHTGPTAGPAPTGPATLQPVDGATAAQPVSGSPLPPTGAQAGLPVAGAAPQAGAPALPTTAPAPTGPLAALGPDGLIYAVFGLGALLLGLVGYLWFRPGPGATPDMPKRVRKVPELGIFGVGTPPMDRGASQWIAGPEDEADLVRALLARLARSRAVVVHVPDEAPLPELAGGPVYRLWSEKPGLLVDAVDALLDAHRPPVVLLVGPPPGGLKKWIKAIGEETAVYTVTRSVDEAGGTAVACRRVPGGWQMVVEGREVRLREGPDGLGPA